MASGPSGVFNLDGTDSSLSEGYDVAPVDAIYVAGSKQLLEGVADGAITPGHALIAGTVAGEVAPAAAGATGGIIGFAKENELGRAGDGITVLDPYADGDRVGYYINDGDLYLSVLADGAVTRHAELEVGAVAGSYRAVTTGKAVVRYMGHKDAADGDRIVVKVLQ